MCKSNNGEDYQKVPNFNNTSASRVNWKSYPSLFLNISSSGNDLLFPCLLMEQQVAVSHGTACFVKTVEYITTILC